MGKRDRYTMVEEDNPEFARFWNAFPRRVSKKDARKAWLEINPDPATVDRMVCTLSWQSEEWARDRFRYCPYPASWLRDERWTDEPPPQVVRRMSQATAQVFAVLGVKP